MPGKYTLKATIVKGMRTTLGKVKKFPKNVLLFLCALSCVYGLFL